MKSQQQIPPIKFNNKFQQQIPQLKLKKKRRNLKKTMSTTKFNKESNNEISRKIPIKKPQQQISRTNQNRNLKKGSSCPGNFYFILNFWKKVSLAWENSCWTTVSNKWVGVLFKFDIMFKVQCLMFNIHCLSLIECLRSNV